MLRQFLVICGCILLFVFVFAAMVLFGFLFNLLIDKLDAFFLAKTSSKVLAFLGTCTVLIAAVFLAYGVSSVCASFTGKIMNSYQSFKNENSDTNTFSEVYNDPTIGLKDKVLFFSIYLIYGVQLPFLYCASKVSELYRMILRARAASIHIFLPLVNAILLIPVVLLELIKYPLVKLFSPLGLNVQQLSFLFNVSGIGTGSQSVHTGSFEYSVLQCAMWLKQNFGAQPNILDHELAGYINNSDEFSRAQRELLQLYLNFNGSNRATWRESRIQLTLTQAANLVLAAARRQNLDIELLKCMLVMRLQEGNGACNLGMFNRIIYSLSSLEARNNFTAEVNDQVYGRMTSITEEFIRNCNNKKIRALKDNFDNFYSESDMDLQAKNSVENLIEEARQFVFNTLYVDYYNRYGQEVGRGPIKRKLKELITSNDIKEAVAYVIENIETPEEPATYFEKVKIFFGGIARFSAA
ncbi:MAG: hypothetical protein PG981_000289 [Wolbachia endosymbiont of Ctenocephalides orientis wCori]|nr:MAG: hypothetical protein PG981_000289 [Wolbachia endosymbiont of Ctenocephalides orientis wCori]